ncbi:MAG TPA: polysaccharide deacetylase family protein [Candidatus Rubrimentiphilum sp.]|nr:polysaccharide deacetylase family protein [Candidatus Rubrimentiphilum sp.]
MKRIALRVGAIVLGLAILGFVAYKLYELFEQPTNQIFGRTVTQGPLNERLVALTYDDGPNPPYTNRILDVLEREHVHATFFLVGRAAQAYPDVVRREVRDGDAIGNHSWDHKHLIVFTRGSVMQSLRKTDAAIYRAAGIHTRLFRPPFGARDWLVMQAAQRLGYTVVMWSVPLARDWEYPPAQTIADRELRRTRDGSILVLHDGNRGLLCSADRLKPHLCDRTGDIAATKLIVETLKQHGYRFVTVPQLMAAGRNATRTGGRLVE